MEEARSDAIVQLMMPGGPREVLEEVRGRTCENITSRPRALIEMPLSPRFPSTQELQVRNAPDCPGAFAGFGFSTSLPEFPLQTNTDTQHQRKTFRSWGIKWTECPECRKKGEGGRELGVSTAATLPAPPPQLPSTSAISSLKVVLSASHWNYLSKAGRVSLLM